MNSGEVSQFEQGQQSVQDTQRAQTISPAPAPVPAQQQPTDSAMIAPDPIGFATQKLGGADLAQAGQGPLEEKLSFTNWLPLLRRLSVSPTSSGLLQRAFVERMSQEMKRPTGTKTALIRQRDFDNRLEQLNNGRG